MIGILASPWTLAVWAVVVAVCLVWTVRDLMTRNGHLMSLMKVVWGLTVLYAGPLGVLAYRLAGRKEIADDGVVRRGGRSVAHCFSGCGGGEVIGVLLAVGVLSLGNWWTAAITFSLAYVFGIALTVGPTMQEGTGFGVALKDAFIAETPSIVVMEMVAIGVDTWITGPAGMGHPIFWSGLVVSLCAGLVAAWPVNVILIQNGVKAGMMDPRMTDHG